MSQTETTNKDKVLLEIPIVIGVFRGLFTILLGIALWINPDKLRTMLGNFMGFLKNSSQKA